MPGYSRWACVATRCRGVLDELAGLTSRHALVVLDGLGGSGKTVALWQWARAMARHEGHRAGAFTVLEFARMLPPFWVSGTICGWRKLPIGDDRRREDDEVAFARLKAANGTLPDPLLHLAIDGADELVEGSAPSLHLQSLLRWCWEEEQRVQRSGDPPRMTLVVTCRDRRELAEAYLEHNRHHFDDDDSAVPAGVEVTDFTPDELLTAVRSQAPTVYDRLQQVLVKERATSPLSSPGFSEIRILGPKGGAARSIAPTILAALRHPVIWRALLGLSTPLQNGVLDNEQAATRALAREVITRFAGKVWERRQVGNLSRDDVREALRAIAMRTRAREGATPNDYARDWRDPACRDTGDLLNSNEARALFREARSGGIIEQDTPRVWRWRHQLVRDYLADGETSEEYEVTV